MPGSVLRAVVTRVGGALRELGELAAMGKQTTMCKPRTMRDRGCETPIMLGAFLGVS